MSERLERRRGLEKPFSRFFEQRGGGVIGVDTSGDDERERRLRFRSAEFEAPARFSGGSSASKRSDDEPSRIEVIGHTLSKEGDSDGDTIDHGQSGAQTMTKKEKKRNRWKVKMRNKHWEKEGGEEFVDGGKGRLHTKRIFWKGSLDSQGCPTASHEEVRDILHYGIMVLGAYAKDLKGLTKDIQGQYPKFQPDGVVAFEHPKGKAGMCPPYFIHVDHVRKEVGMYIRGLKLVSRTDYVALLANRKGEQELNDGYVHYGMYKPARWSVENIAPVLKQHLLANEGYRLTLVGHSLGAGVAAILALLLIENRDAVGGISANFIHCYVFAPPRIMSLDLAIKYSSNVHSVIYQDDFLPRVSTSSVKRVFLYTFAITGVTIFYHWLKQACTPDEKDDIRRLYPPGSIYHCVYKQPGVPGHQPIQVRVVPHSQGRFERLVLSSAGTATNHSVLKLAKHLKKKYEWPKHLIDW